MFAVPSCAGLSFAYLSVILSIGLEGAVGFFCINPGVAARLMEVVVGN